MSELRLAICDPTEGSRERLKQLVMGIERACLEADCSRFEFFFDVVKTTQPEVCLINIDHDVEIATSLITQLNRNFPQTGIIAISSSTEGALILQIMRAGAREFLRAPVDAQELVSSLERVSVHSDPSKRPKSGKIIAVAGASGGVGTTSVSVNLACSMAQIPDESIALVDLDLSLGDADVFLDSIPEYTLLDVAQNVERLDLSLLRKSLTKHDSGVYLLPRPVQLQDIDEISASNFNRVLKLLKASFTNLIVDLSKSYNSLDIRTLMAADEILLLTQLDLPCLRNVVRLLTSLEAMEGITEKIKIVVNRSGLESGQISLKKAEAHIGRDIYWQVPNNFSAVSEGRNNGVPLIFSAPNAAITQNIISLSDALINGEDGDDSSKGDKKERKGLFGFLSKG